MDQFPAVKVNDKYYTMSLRMMKAVWCVITRPPCVPACGLRLRGRVQAERALAAGLREPGACTVRWREAAHPFSALRGEDAHPESLQCGLHSSFLHTRLTLY